MSDEYLTEAILKSVLDEFEWPEPFTIEDWLPDGILVAFPRCQLFFVEGVDAIAIEFLSENTGVEAKLTHKHALRAVRSTLDPAKAPPEPVPTTTFGAPPSIERVQSNIRDLCTLVLTYLRPTLTGDFSWVEVAKEHLQ